MKKKHVMSPMEEVDVTSLKYENEVIQAPHAMGLLLRIFAWAFELPILGQIFLSILKKRNQMDKILRHTLIPEQPMFRPEFPSQEPEPGTVVLDEDDKPAARVELALNCLRPYDPARLDKINSSGQFLYWTIRDYAHAYRSKIVTPSIVVEHVISAVEDSEKMKPPMSLLVSFNASDLRKQAAASTKRFEEGQPLSFLDGIFIAIKDDIDCYPYPTKGGSTWFHTVRPTKDDAVCVSRLRSCGAILVGKANMHEMGLGTTGNNPNNGTTRNPHSVERYTGGSSSGCAALVSSGICQAAIGTDAGGSVRIPSALCGVVGLKTTYGRNNMKGCICECGTVEVVAPIAATVEDVMLVYAAMLGSSPSDRISLHPSPPCLPYLSPESLTSFGSLKLGKYTKWFHDVYSVDISTKCEDVLNLLEETFGFKTIEVVVPELLELRLAHAISIGSETVSSLNPECVNGKSDAFTLDTRITMALFRSFSGGDYVSAQRIRRRLMYYHMEIFKKVDVIVTPTTGITAPVIPPQALQSGETNLSVTGYLMRFALTGNLLGLPAITIPVGHDKQGLPIGLQIIGRPWGEATVLKLASVVEELCLSAIKRPSVFYDVLKS